MGKGRKRKEAAAAGGKRSVSAKKVPSSVGVTPQAEPAGAEATPVLDLPARENTPVIPVRSDTVPGPAPTNTTSRAADPATGGSDRRIFRRVPFFRKIEYRFQTIEEFRSRFANDISLGGMFIRTDDPAPMGTVIFLQFDLQDGSKILTGYGKVVRVNPRGVPDFDPGMGVEFLKFDDESLQRIKQLIAERFPGAR